MFGFLNVGLLELLLLQRPTGKTYRHSIPRRLRRLVFHRASGLCVYCETLVLFENGTVDHYTPLAFGGSLWDVENMYWACLKCNAVKGDSRPVEEIPAVDRLSLRFASLDSIRNAERKK